MDSTITWVKNHPVELGSLLILLLIIFGISLGIKKVVIVYRDFTDIGIVCLTVLIPWTAFIALLYIGFSDIERIKIPFLIFEGVMLAVITVRSYIDNRNLLKTLVAVIIKIPLAVILIVNIIDFIAPSTHRKRRNPLVVLFLVMPLVLALVDKKEGAFTPTNALKRYGIK